MADTIGVPCARRSRLRLILAAAALMLAPGLILAAIPIPTLAASIMTTSEIATATNSDYSTIFTHVTDTVIDPEDNPRYPDIDDLYYWGSRHSVSMDVTLPDDATGGDTYTLALDSPVWTWTTIPDGLTVANKAGTALATVNRTDPSTLSLTLADSVNGLKDITGAITVQATHRGSGSALLGREPGTVVDVPFTVLGGDGTNLGPDKATHFRVSYPLSTDFTQSQQIYDEHTVGFSLTSRVIAGSPSSADFSQMDVRSFTATHTVSTTTSVPVCSPADFGRPAVRASWATGTYPEATTGDALRSSDLVVSCDPTTQTVVISLADGVAIPKEATGLTATSYWVAEAPGKIHDVHGALVVEGVSAGSSPWVKDRRVTSPSIKGEADGTVRAVDTTITKTSDNMDKPLKTGEKVTYTLTARNTDTVHTATGVVISDALPQGLQIESASDKGTYDKQTRLITWPKADLPAGTSRAVTVTTTVTRDTAGTIANTGTITGDNLNCRPASDCTSTRDITVANPAFTAHKLAEATDSNGDGVTGDSGDQIQYSFTIANVGETTIDSAKLADELLGVSEVEMLSEPLATGAETTFSDLEPYTITDSDVEASQVTNVGTVTVESLDPIHPSVETPTLAAPEPEPSSASPLPSTSSAAPASPDVPPSSPDDGSGLAHTGADTMAFGGVPVLLVLASSGIHVLRRRLLAQHTSA